MGARKQIGIGLSYRPARPHKAGGIDSLDWIPKPVFLNVYGAKESIPRNEFRQPM